MTILVNFSSPAQTLNLPPRLSDAPSGTAFEKMIEPLAVPLLSPPSPLRAREFVICSQVLQGNVPSWMRQMTLVSTNAIINGTNHTVSYYIIPDYVAVGSDEDYFLIPMTPLLAQRIADATGCILPTAKMVNDIWKKAPCHLDPSTIAPSAAMTTVPVFDDSNRTIRGQRFAVTNTYPLGTLTGGDKKDVIISSKIYSNFTPNTTTPVVIYGWHQLNGSPIQPVYNGHEETYADYSHGIRLVQMNLTVDGQPNTITNVLTNPNLAGTLSDDPYSGANVIPNPRYTMPTMAPVMTTHPRSQSIVSNTTVMLNAFAIGDYPMSYQWTFNGSTLPGATNTTLTIASIQFTNTGLYGVVVSNAAGSASAIPALLSMKTATHPVVFSDDFETNSASRWELFSDASNGLPDYTVDWAYDYAAQNYKFNGVDYVFIPRAPNSGVNETRAVRLTVNNNDTNAAIAAVNLYPKNAAFSNDYALKFDMWINYPGNAAGAGAVGSTEHAIFGLNHLGTEANWAATTATGTDGLWFAVDGDGGTTRDYRVYVGNPAGLQTELTGTTSGLTAADNANSFYTTLFPLSRFETSGAPGKNWVEVELRQVGNIITWLINGTVIAQRTNTSAFTSGNVMIGFMDTFSSIASPSDEAFVLFDNVRVEDLTQTLQPPTITTPPPTMEVNAGTNVTFSVAATGSNPLLYQWSCNGVQILGATSATLTLTNVQSPQTGTYAVIVTNAAGFASAAATLSVISQVPKFGSISRASSGAAQLSFSGDNGSSYLLEASTNLMVWKPVSVLAISNGPLSFLDLEATNFGFRFYRSHSSATTLLTGFEPYASGSTVMFQRPSASGSTSNFLDLAAGDYAFVTNAFPAGHTGAKILAVGWSFKTGTSNPWLRLTTFNAATLPNPIVGASQALQFDLYSDHDVYVALGLRETNPTGAIGGDGGTSGTIEYVGGSTANVTPPKGRLVPANQWTTLTFFLPFESVRGFTGNGILETTTGKFVLEHLAFVPVVSGAHSVYLDNFEVMDLSP